MDMNVSVRTAYYNITGLVIAHCRSAINTSSQATNCIAGSCIGYIVFPSHKNNVYMFSKVYCYFMWEKKISSSAPGQLDDPSRVPS
jgi:hypothetical protein